MKLKDILIEAESDKKNRSIAEKVYENLISYLEGNLEVKVKTSLNVSNLVLSVDLSDFYKSMMSEYYPLELRFHSKFSKKTKADLRWGGINGSVMNLYHVDFEILYQNLGIPLDTDAAKLNSKRYLSILNSEDFEDDAASRVADELRVVRDLRESFFEEIHHYLDYVRTEGDVKFGDKGGYWEKNTEVNAKVQSAITSFKKDFSGDVENLPPGYQFQEEWRKDFQSFKDWFFDEKLSKELVDGLSEDQYKSVVKRLYQFWKDELNQ